MTETVDPNLIFDVGVHEGQDTRFYLSKGFRVVGIEAAPDLAQRAKAAHADDVARGRLVIENVAVAEANGPVTLYVNNHTAWNTIRPEWVERNAAMGAPPSSEVVVPGVKMADLIRRHGVPHYVKIDIEGVDLLALEAFGEFEERPDFVSIESEKLDWSALVAEFDLLERLGYRRFKVVNQRTVPRQRPPKPAREGVDAPATFEVGSSGLFGDDLPGRWLTRREALLRYRPIFFRYRTSGDLGWSRQPGVVGLTGKVLRKLHGSPGWYDTHAAR